MLTKIKVNWKEDAVSHFMTELIDYAGLFPPAALPLREAILNYHSYFQEEDSWMLGPFVIPASRLVELEPFRDLFNEQTPLRLSIILSKSDALGTDLDAIQLFSETYQTAGIIEAIEFPPSFQMNSDIFEKLDKLISGYRIYGEIAGTSEQLQSSLEKIMKLNQDFSRPIGVKFRMGGITANLFPSADRAAYVIHECKKLGLSLKFTAGLHHPVRQYRKEVTTFMHGFVNVFTASIMAYCLSISEETIEEILLDDNPDHFTFTSNELSWRNLAVSSKEINTARNVFSLSYGSCSFVEPREELGELLLFHEEAVR
ncbi:hypothetical protein [Bacillus sp. UNC438CL73TsuS30]|uniref:hypothetical protein n=1 Tax=Bacillus sp. UNC438CL73TsuS30 TaxID=1340434 RepID=UPI00068FC4D0|nr:hypothetical protein [Bacillus sp. UNC438CL73TsuS30]